MRVVSLLFHDVYASDPHESGFRLPLIVISPWARQHFVSHVNRDSTAILKLIETRFNIPALTQRDAVPAQARGAVHHGLAWFGIQQSQRFTK